MPFQSEKQRRYMHANLPEIAKRWERDYANGGIARVGLANGSIGNKTHAETFLDLYQNSPTTKDYNINVNADLANRISEGLGSVPYVGGALSTVADVAMPAAAFIGSPFYDAIQGTYRGIKDPNKSVWQAIKDENIGSTMWERMVGASAPLAERLSNLNFGSSAQAAEPAKIKAMRQDLKSVPAHMQRQTSFPIAQQDDEDNPYDFTDRLRRRKDFTTKYPSYNPWQMRGAQAPGWKRNVGRMMDFLTRTRTRLTPAQQRANQSYMTQQRITRDPQTGRMQGGLFAGQNAPGTSFFGSKTFPEMAQKWALKNQQRQYTTPKMQQKQRDIISVATGGRDPSQGNTVTGHGKSGMGRDPSDRMARGGLASLWPR